MCGGGMPNYTIIDYDSERAQSLGDLLGHAWVVSSAQEAIERGVGGPMTVMVAQSAIVNEDGLQSLLDRCNYHVLVYDRNAKPRQIAEDTVRYIERSEGAVSLLPPLPASICMVLKIWGKRPRPANPTNPVLVV